MGAMTVPASPASSKGVPNSESCVVCLLSGWHWLEIGRHATAIELGAVSLDAVLDYWGKRHRCWKEFHRPSTYQGS